MRVGLVASGDVVISDSEVRTLIFTLDAIDEEYLVSSSNQTLVLWLDAEHPNLNYGDRPSDEASMQYWYDRSYYAAQGIQNLTSKRPTYESTSGYAVKFDGSSDAMLFQHEDQYNVGDRWT